MPAHPRLSVAALVLAGGFLQGQTAAPLPPDTLANAGARFLKDGNYVQAEETFRKLRESAPNDERGLRGLVETLALEGKQDDALQMMRLEMNRNPSRRDYRVAYANLLARAERYDEALAIFREDLKPDSLDLLGLADLFHRKGDLNTAMVALGTALAVDPNNAEAAFQLALVFEAGGQRQAAVPLYEQLLKFQPGNPVVLNNLAYAMAESGTDLKRALEMAELAHQEAKDSAPIADTLGWIYIKMKQGQDAVALYQPLVEKNPTVAAFHYHFALALQLTDDKAGALRELNLALQNKPSKDDEAKIKDLLSGLEK